MRLIDADVLKEYIDMQKGRNFAGCTIGEALKTMTDEQPTVLTSYEYELAKMFLNRLAVRMETAILTGEDNAD